jgi:hypothetical protein
MTLVKGKKKAKSTYNFTQGTNMLIQRTRNSPEPELSLAWLDMLDLHASDEVTSGLRRPSTCSALKTERLL